MFEIEFLTINHFEIVFGSAFNIKSKTGVVKEDENKLNKRKVKSKGNINYSYY